MESERESNKQNGRNLNMLQTQRDSELLLRPNERESFEMTVLLPLAAADFSRRKPEDGSSESSNTASYPQPPDRNSIAIAETGVVASTTFQEPSTLSERGSNQQPPPPQPPATGPHPNAPPEIPSPVSDSREKLPNCRSIGSTSVSPYALSDEPSFHRLGDQTKLPLLALLENDVNHAEPSGGQASLYPTISSTSIPSGSAASSNATIGDRHQSSHYRSNYATRREPPPADQEIQFARRKDSGDEAATKSKYEYRDAQGAGLLTDNDVDLSSETWNVQHSRIQNRTRELDERKQTTRLTSSESEKLISSEQTSEEPQPNESIALLHQTFNSSINSSYYLLYTL